MQLNGTQTKIGIVVVVLLVIGLGYFLWTRSATPEPTIPSGQSLSNPLGEKRGGPARAGGPGGPSGFTAPGGGTQVNVPAKGTVDKQRGFGPSKGAPIPGTQ